MTAEQVASPEVVEVQAGDSKPGSEPDRVAMVSYRADGTPDQTPGYEVIDPDAAPAPAEPEATDSEPDSE